MASITSFGQNNKNIPENTLSIIKAEEREIYLMRIHRIPVEIKEYPIDSWYGKARKRGEFLYVSFIEGNYPVEYTTQSYYMNIITENKIIEFEIWNKIYFGYKNDKFVKDGEPLEQWENVGYSTDNTIWTKIYEYYLENKDKSKNNYQ